MEQSRYSAFVRILQKELVPALGCTEPIAIAYAAAIAKDVLGTIPEHMIVSCSGNIIKNVKGVVVPATGGLKGIEAAALIGAVGGVAERKLEVLTCVTEKDQKKTRELLERNICQVKLLPSSANLHIIIEMDAGKDTVLVETVYSHTGIVRIEKNGLILYSEPYHDGEMVGTEQDYQELTMEHIMEFAETVKMKDIGEILRRQITYNTAIANAGMTEVYGACVGSTLKEVYGDSFLVMAKAMPAAGSDARMGGCELPVVINSGSGNQGMTVSLPVIECAKELKVTEEWLYRALCISNLTAIYQKRDIGKLSAYCGAVSAAAGAGAGMCFLMGGGLKEISEVVTYTLANVAGMICDGAKASCAAKIAAGVDAALLAIHMSQRGRKFLSGEGIVKDSVARTISGISTIARDGMKITDEVILTVMVGK